MPTQALINKISDHWHRIKHHACRLLHHTDTIIAPPFCASCKKLLVTRSVFCDACAIHLQKVVSTHVPLTTTRAITVHAVAAYKEPLKSLIIAKSHGNIAASRSLAHLMIEHLPIDLIPCDYFIPIPLHWLRRMKRGYNQAEEIAGELAKHRTKPVAPILSRTRYTRFQSRMPFNHRQTNVRGAFALKGKNPEQYTGKHLVLIDDLLTSGATISEAARALLPLKPASITALVGARVIRI